MVMLSTRLNAVLLNSPLAAPAAPEVRVSTTYGYDLAL